MNQQFSTITSVGHESGPYLVETVYPSEQVIIANVIATHEPYCADPTGAVDSTAAIQAALDACYAMGGGTVFLPVGRYLVTDTVRIPYGVVLQGDWQDPDLTDEPEYGTVILARPRALDGTVVCDPTEGVLFELMHEGDANNGLIGLTVFYPEQDIHNVKCYGYTIYGHKPRMVMLRDLTLINSYQGIGACLGSEGTHELLQVENVRMTVLSMGYKAKRSREIGYTLDLRISPRYWARAAGAFACNDAEALRRYCRANTVGIEFETLDLNQYTGIEIESCHTALLSRTGFWGTFYGVEIRDCVYGLVAQDVCGANGILLANANIEADKYAVANYAARQGGVKLAGVKATGKGGLACIDGAHLLVDDIDHIERYPVRKGQSVRPASRLYVADIAQADGQRIDAAPAIQAALDRAAASGGIVYLPHGVYSVYAPLTVPTGVELRGAMPMAVRDKGAPEGLVPGTVLLCYVNDGDFVTLSEASGIEGVRIFYPAYDATTALEHLQRGDAVVERAVAVRGRGPRVYAKNIVISGAMVGIDVTGCDEHRIKQAFGCAHHRFVRAGGKDGTVESVLCNMTFTTRQPFVIRGLYDPDRSDSERWQIHGYETGHSFDLIRDLVLRSYCDTVELIDAEGELLDNVFMYGCRRILRARRSSAVCYNVTSDWQSGETMLLVEEGSDVVAFNPLRTSGISHECDESSSLTVYNRIVNSNVFEPTLRKRAGESDDADRIPGRELGRLELLDCESIDGIEGVTLNTDPAFIKKGTASLKHEGAGALVFDASFAPVDATALGEGELYLHMSVWIEHTVHHAWHDRSRITLTDVSGKGGCFEWSTTSFVTVPGWNECYLPLKAGHIGVARSMSVSALSGLKMTFAYNGLGIYPTIYIDDVYLCAVEPRPTTTACVEPTELDDYATPDPVVIEHPTRILLEDGETLSHVVSAAALNTDPAYVKEGTASIRSLTEDEVKLELRFPDTDATEYKDYGFLHMWVYVEDVAGIGARGQIELCSGGDKDAGERFWTTTSYVKRSGWNELWLPIHRSALSTAKPPHDPSHINYIRFYTSSRKTPTMVFDDIYLCNKADASVYDESNTRPVGWQGGADGTAEKQGG